MCDNTCHVAHAIIDFYWIWWMKWIHNAPHHVMSALIPQALFGDKLHPISLWIHQSTNRGHGIIPCKYLTEIIVLQDQDLTARGPNPTLSVSSGGNLPPRVVAVFILPWFKLTRLYFQRPFCKVFMKQICYFYTNYIRSYYVNAVELTEGTHGEMSFFLWSMRLCVC